jgi:leucyl-tRNA synthetase
MSKSKKNVVDPDELIEQHGADTIRLFCLFAAPPEKDLDWSDQGVEGAFRFLGRVWRIIQAHAETMKDVKPYHGKEDLPETLRNLRRKTHQTIRKVTEDLEERFHFNTAISAIMELVNTLYQFDVNSVESPFKNHVLREAMETIVLLLYPVSPHITEELWQILGHTENISKEAWPSYDPEVAKEEEMVIVIQINGKLRGQITVPVNTLEQEIKTLAQNDERTKQWTEGKKIVKIIYVPRKLINMVVQ